MNIVVIGAGLSGLSASLGLAKAGYHVELIEKRNDFDARGATFGLAPNGRKALAELLRPDESVIDHISRVGTLEPANGGLMLPWWEVRDCLLENVRRNENIRLRTGLSVRRIDDDSDPSCARVHFESCDDVLEGKLVIGADGVRSSVRRLLGLPPAEKAGTAYWRGSVDASKDGSMLASLLDKGPLPLGTKLYGKAFLLLFNFHPKVPGKIGWSVTTKAHNIEPGTTPWTLVENYLEEGDEKELVRNFFRECDDEELKTFYYVQTLKLPDPGNGWGGRGRVTLIGDAAHALRPTDGQGGSMAFEDSLVFCRMLEKEGKQVLDEKYSCEQFITRFENERLSRVKVISDDQTTRAESGYRGEQLKVWDDDFRDWVLNGV